MPPFEPTQFHDHGPVPVKIVTLPALQRALKGGVDENDPPLSDPHAPLTGEMATVAVKGALETKHEESMAKPVPQLLGAVPVLLV